MENAVDALKIAFGIFVLMLAIAVAMGSFSMAKTASDVILYTKDETNYYEYEEGDVSNNNRTVGIETIIPTLYRYYKERYRVEFKNSNGSNLSIYKSTNGQDINYFDLDEEFDRYEPWTASTEEMKKNLDAFLKGVTYNNPSNNNPYRKYGQDTNLGSGGFIGKYKSRKFIETIRIERANVEENGVTKEKEKRVIVYTLIN